MTQNTKDAGASQMQAFADKVRDGIADYIADNMADRKHSLAEIDTYIRAIEINADRLAPTAEQADLTLIRALQKALAYWMPKVFDDRSAHDAYLLVGYDGADEQACCGDEMVAATQWTPVGESLPAEPGWYLAIAPENDWGLMSDTPLQVEFDAYTNKPKTFTCFYDYRGDEDITAAVIAWMRTPALAAPQPSQPVEAGEQASWCYPDRGRTRFADMGDTVDKTVSEKMRAVYYAPPPPEFACEVAKIANSPSAVVLDDERAAIALTDKQILNICKMYEVFSDLDIEFIYLGHAIIMANDRARKSCADAQSAEQTAQSDFKNFHRLLCDRFGYMHDEQDWQRDQLSLIEWIAARAASPQAKEAPMNGIAATLRHDEGAIARCSYCGRYSLDPKTLSDRQPKCECGEKHGWSGSFKKPGPDAKWSGEAPQATATQPVQTDDARDAKRYRWLRKEHFPTAANPPLAQVIWKARDNRHGPEWVNLIDGNDLDRAVDAAMTAAQPASDQKGDQ